MELKFKSAPSSRAVVPTCGGGRRRLNKQGKRILAGVLALVVLGGAGFYWSHRGRQAGQVDRITSQTAETRDIVRRLTGTGTLKPVNEYNVNAQVTGRVLEDHFQEGDQVKAGQLLYRIDPAEALRGVEEAKLALQQSQLSYEQQTEGLRDLRIKALRGGMITELFVGVGDRIEAGAKIATIRDSATMLLTVPFNAAAADQFTVGQIAQVTVAGSFETVAGKIRSIDAAATVQSGFQMVKNVTLSVINPGALSPTATATASIGGVASNSGAAFQYNAESAVTAQIGGTVTAISAAAGGVVQARDTLVTLSSASLDGQAQGAALALRSSQLAAENAEKAIGNYNVTSPIDGTVITKNIKAGDTLGAASAQSTPSGGSSAMAVIYDLSALVFDIPLNELDINSVKVGQKVKVQVDALGGQSFDGVVIRRSVAGNTEKGTTTYPVTVRIDHPPAELLPGMNVGASIEVAAAHGVVAVPMPAVQYGNVVYVKDKPGGPASGPADDPNCPPGYHAVPVETGITDGDYIEIKRGLEPGDEVSVPEDVPSADDMPPMDDMPMDGETMIG